MTEEELREIEDAVSATLWPVLAKKPNSRIIGPRQVRDLIAEVRRLRGELQKVSDSELLARLGDREVSRLRECEDHLRQWELWAADVDSRRKTV